MTIVRGSFRSLDACLRRLFITTFTIKLALTTLAFFTKGTHAMYHIH